MLKCGLNGGGVCVYSRGWGVEWGCMCREYVYDQGVYICVKQGGCMCRTGGCMTYVKQGMYDCVEQPWGIFICTCRGMHLTFALQKALREHGEVHTEMV